MFWLVSSVVLIAAGMFLAWPLLSRGSPWKGAGLAVALALPIAGLILYQNVGTPSALDVEATAPPQDMNEMVDSLRGRLSEREEDLEGWLLLGRSLKSLKRFPESVSALETAERIEPDNPLIQVELAESRLYASGNPQISEDIRTILLRAVEQDPTLQKGLWLLGIDAVQRGEDALAVEYWVRLLDQVEPDNPVAQTVREQIALARERLGEPAPQVEPPVSGADWQGIQVEVSLDDADAAEVPANSVLFVIVRPPGVAGGPPLGVARVNGPRFPVSLTIDDENSMIPGRALSGFEQLTLRARLSLTGQVMPGPGDRESEEIEVERERESQVSLSLDRIVE